MEHLKTVGIKTLKDNLSAYIRDVARGAHVLVTDHDRVVAELVEPLADRSLPDAESSLLASWIKAGKVSAPKRPKKKITESFLKLPEGTTLSLIEADRGS